MLKVAHLSGRDFVVIDHQNGAIAPTARRCHVQSRGTAGGPPAIEAGDWNILASQNPAVANIVDFVMKSCRNAALIQHLFLPSGNLIVFLLRLEGGETFLEIVP